MSKKNLMKEICMRVNGQVCRLLFCSGVIRYNMDKSNKMTTKTNDTTSDNASI